MEPFIPPGAVPPVDDEVLFEEGVGIGPALEDEDGTTLADAVPVGDPNARLELEPEEESEIANYLSQLLGEFDTALEKRRKREEEIQDAYDLVPDSRRTGPQPNAAQVCSEVIKSNVDQATARIMGAVNLAKPLISVAAEMDESGLQEELLERKAEAQAAQDFLNNYARTQIRLKPKLRTKVLRATKFGTAVTRDMWVDRVEEVQYIDELGEQRTQQLDRSGIEMTLIDNSDFFLWPLTIEDWQADYEVVGHRARLSKWRFRRRLEEIGVDDEVIEELAPREGSGAGEEDDRSNERLTRKRVDAAAVTEDRYQLTEVWYHGAIGDLDPGKYIFFLHEETRTLLYAQRNPLHCRKHPYHPIRYKRQDGFAFGEGMGDELVMAHAIESTLDNLELDSLKVVANHVVLFDPDFAQDFLKDQFYPGVRVPVQGLAQAQNEPVQAFPLGGELTTIYQAKQENRFRVQELSGFSSVLRGQGDPTMRSGADASSVLALIGEAGRKFADVDECVRDDLSDEVTYWLELIAQYAPNGLFYSRLSSEGAQRLERVRYEPPRRELSTLLRIRVTAPSAATNREMMQQRLLVLYNLVTTHVQMIERMGQEVLAAKQDVAQLIELKQNLMVFLNRILELIFRFSDADELVPEIPELKEPSLTEQMFNQLVAQLAQMQQQLQMVQMQAGMVPPEQQQQQQPAEPQGGPVGLVPTGAQ